MADLSALSDDELLRMAGEPPKPKPKRDLSSVSNEDLLKMAREPEPAPAPPKREKLSITESAISGLAQGLTFGFADEIGGAINAMIGVVKGEGGFEELRKKATEIQRAHQKKAFDDNPKTFAGANIGGAIGSLALPGGAFLAPAKGAGKAANIARAAAGGGLVGAGTSTGDVTTLEGAKDIALDIGKGAALGGGFQFGLQKAGGLIDKIKPGAVKKFAEEKAVKAAGAVTKDFKRLEKLGKLHEVGRKLLDEKVVTVGATLDDIFTRAGALREKAGDAIGKALGEADELVKRANKMIDEGKLFGFLPAKGEVAKAVRKGLSTKEDAKAFINNHFQFNMQQVATRLRKEIIEPNSANPTLKNEIKKVARMARDFENLPPQTLKNANAIKTTQGKLTRFDSETVPQAFKQDVYRILKEEIDETVGRMGNLEKAIGEGLDFQGLVASNLRSIKDSNIRKSIARSTFEDAKASFGIAKEAESIAEGAIARESARSLFGLRDVVAAGAGLASGSIAHAIALGAISKAARTFGPRFQAVGADKLAQVLSKAPNSLGRFGSAIEEAAKRGPGALIAAHVALMGKEPEYRQIIRGQ